MKIALVIGCSCNVWEEVQLAQDMVMFDSVYCVKLAGVHYPGAFKTWVTLHPEWMDDYEEQREKFGYPGGYEIVAPPSAELGMHGAKGRIARRVPYRWPGMTHSAASGIYGAKVALDDGFEKVILAGIPMSAEDGHFLPETRSGGNGPVRGKVWTQLNQFVCGLNEATPHLMGKVKSMSGYTKKILGAPTREWIGEADPA